MRHTIKIGCSAEGDISYNIQSLVVKREDTIEWVCENDYSFAVHFGWDSPLGKGRYRAGIRDIINDKVPANAPFGEHKYFVAVFDGNNIWTDDPRIIIRR